MSDETTPQDGKAMSPASTGSVPVAWAVVYPNDEVAIIAFKRRDADERASASDRVVPLYRQPTLTDAEREAIKDAISCCEDITYGGAADQEAADVLNALLERTK